MRRNSSIGLLVVGLLFLFSGCMQSKTIVTVNKDGSGAIEQTLYTAKMDIPNVPVEPEKTDAQLAEHYTEVAKSMGEGVTLKSATALKDKPGSNGVKVIFAFADIAKVSLSPIAETPGTVPNKDGDLHFEFAKGATNKLTVVMPPIKPMANPNEQDKPKTAEEEKQENDMMAAMFKDMLIHVELNVEGTISQTSAAYPNAKKDGVTLMHQDFGGMLKDEAAMKVFKEINKLKDVKAMLTKLKDPVIAKYMQIEPSEKTVIEFK